MSYSWGNRISINVGGGGSVTPSPYPTGMTYDPITGDVVLTLNDGTIFRANTTSVKTVLTEADFLLLPSDIGQRVLVTSTGEVWTQALNPVTDALSWKLDSPNDNIYYQDDLGGDYVDELGNTYVAVPGP